MKPLEIPGDYLEGGGQILRTALSLSCITRKPIKIFNIRAKRPKPGLSAQHFHTIRALKEISLGKVEGFSLGSNEIEFSPAKIISIPLNIDIKTAGSIGLLLQSLLPVAIFSPAGIKARIKGGTAGKHAIPVEWYPAVFLPILSRIGINAKVELIRRGYYPKGGGLVEARIENCKKFMPLELTETGKITRIQGISHAHKELAKAKVAQRQSQRLIEILGKRFSCPIDIKAEYCDALSLGSGIVVWATTEKGAIIESDSLGEKGKPSEDVARQVSRKLIKEIDSGAPVDVHLADNLILYLALASGRIKVSEVSLHTQTNIWLIEQFFGKIFEVKDNLISTNKISTITKY